MKFFVTRLFSKLVGAHSTNQIETFKYTNSPFVDDKALKYLNTIVNNNEQYPGVRCEMGKDIYMYQSTALSTTESMKKAKKAA